MFSVFFKYVKICIIIVFILVFFSVTLLSLDPIYSSNKSDSDISSVTSVLDFIWPIPGHTTVSSPFGKRTSPTSGASSYHSGVDLPAPEGTNLYAIADGVVLFASWGAGGGYTITYQLSNYSNIKVSYCHVSPVIYTSKGSQIHKGELVGTVGPKNVYGILNNPYKDSNGNPTNGASTGCHLHFTIKENNKAVNPLKFYKL